MTRMTVAAAVWAAIMAASCSTGDGTDLDARIPAQTAVSTTSEPPVATDLVGATSADDGSEPAATLPSEPTSPVGDTVDETVAASVAETGVPGLDADDAFCAAWARFGGSFQVVAVHAAFGAGTAESTARYELLASPTVVEAYDSMRAVWPDELATESEAAIEQRFGPLAARIGSALTVLRDAGLGDDGADELRAAWLDALATRDPLATEVTVELSDATSLLVDDAVDAYLDAVGPWADDTTLVTDVSTPLTDEYLATECPDQGVLAGQEVG